MSRNKETREVPAIELARIPRWLKYNKATATIRALFLLGLLYSPSAIDKIHQGFERREQESIAATATYEAIPTELRPTIVPESTEEFYTIYEIGTFVQGFANFPNFEFLSEDFNTHKHSSESNWDASTDYGYNDNIIYVRNINTGYYYPISSVDVFYRIDREVRSQNAIKHRGADTNINPQYIQQLSRIDSSEDFTDIPTNELLVADVTNLVYKTEDGDMYTIRIIGHIIARDLITWQLDPSTRIVEADGSIVPYAKSTIYSPAYGYDLNLDAIEEHLYGTLDFAIRFEGVQTEK